MDTDKRLELDHLAEEIESAIVRLKYQVQKFEDDSFKPGRNQVLRALDMVDETMQKWMRTVDQPTMLPLPHPTPMCILHGRPITWDDPECEVCKSLKAGTFNDKVGASDNYRDDSNRSRSAGHPKGNR